MTVPPFGSGGSFEPQPEQERPLAAPGLGRGAVPALVLFALAVVGAAVYAFVAGPGEPSAARPGGARTSVSLRPQVEPPDPSPIAVPPEPQKLPGPKPFRYTGLGSTTLKLGTFPGRPTLLYAWFEGSGVSRITSVRPSGVDGYGVLGVAGPYEGVTVLDDDPDDLTRDVRLQTAGQWVVEVRSIESAPVFTRRASGRGRTVLRYTGRKAVVTGVAPPEDSLWVKTHNAEGFLAGILVAQPGEDGREEWGAGPLLVEVDTDGPWTLSASPL